jgi:V/A-type H+-transporting ATPase subunit D
MAQQVFPTKSNLMATKRSLALATQGYDLMDRKRNILVREMMQLIDRAAGIQDRISAAYAEAYEALKKANIMLGSVGGYAAGVPVERGVQMSTRSVMGVELPTLRLNTTSPMGLYYDLESTNGTLDVAYLKFNEVKTLTVELAEVERRVNEKSRPASSVWPRPSKRPRSAPTPWATCRSPRCKRPSSPSTRS